MDNELQCKKCGKPIKGGCYNVPDGPFCVDCWENKISEKLKKDYEKQALKRLQAIGIGFKTGRIMNRTRLVLRWLLIPLWFAIFIAYLPIWYLQMSWYYFSFQDYWDAFLILWNKTMLSMRLKTRR